MPLTRLFSPPAPELRGLFFRMGKPEGTGKSASPLLTLGASLVGVALFALFVGWINMERSQAVMHNILAEKGKVFLLALEGGLRSGKRMASGMRFQYLLEELAGRDAIRFIAVTMPDGTILAHTDPTRIGKQLAFRGQPFASSDLKKLGIEEESKWNVMDIEGGSAFVVYRTFHSRIVNSQDKGDVLLLPPAGMDHMRHGGGRHRPAHPSEKDGAPMPYIFLGLDTLPLDLAHKQDTQRAVLSSSGVLVVGWLLIICIHALGRMRASRQSQREAEAFAEELAVTLPDGLILFDSRGRVTRMNEAAMSLLGLEDSVREQRTPENVMKAFPVELIEKIDLLLQTSTLEDTELILDRPTGSVYLSVRGGHVGGDDGRLGSMMLLRDLSDVRRLEAEVRRREKLAAMGNLAAGVAHELRNPLSSIKGYATYFSERFPEGSEEREAAHVMVRETERLNRTISDLIGLARPTDIRIRPVDMPRLLDDACRLIRQDAEARGVQIQLDVEPLPAVAIDPDRVRQVVLNLCLNALDAMPHGGTLTLALHKDDARSDCVVLDVRDTGVGIHQSDITHIFDPYFTTKGHGTGLGLATVHKIMEAHGGSVAVSSVVGQGTVFQLVFHTVTA